MESHGWKHFWIYWAVTIPLTIVTLSAWTLYTKLFNPAVPRHGNGDRKPRDEVMEDKGPKFLDRKVWMEDCHTGPLGTQID